VSKQTIFFTSSTRTYQSTLLKPTTQQFNKTSQTYTMAEKTGITPGSFLQLSPPSPSKQACGKCLPSSAEPQAAMPKVNLFLHEGTDGAILGFSPVKKSANTVQERQNILMAELLSRYSKLVSVVTARETRGGTLENQASLSLQTDIETAALVGNFLNGLVSGADGLADQSCRRPS